MKILKLGFDFDNVVADTNRLKARLLERKGILVPQWLCRRRRYLRNIEEYNEVQKMVYEDSYWGMQIKPVDGAIPTIRKARELGHKIFILTSRSKPSSRLGKRLLTEKFELKIRAPKPEEQTGNKEEQAEGEEEWDIEELLSVGSSESSQKRKTAENRELEFYADDDDFKLQPLLGVVENLILFSRFPGEHENRRLPAVESGQVKKMSSWNEIFQEILQIQEE